MLSEVDKVYFLFFVLKRIKKGPALHPSLLKFFKNLFEIQYLDPLAQYILLKG